MQVDKKGNLINLPQFLISGKERIKVKKKVSGLKCFIRNAYRINDVSEVYGCGISNDELNNQIIEANMEIANLEKALAIPATLTN